MKFDRALWVDEDKFYDAPYPRAQMLGDVRSQVLKKGMSRQDVIAALGEPSDSGKFADRGLAYWVSPEKGTISIDSQWLVVALDAQGKVTDTDIATD